MSISKVIMTGNLVRNAELKTSMSGTTILNFTVAVNDRTKNQTTGEWEDYANFINCVMFGRRAESLSSYLNKGQKVAVEGKLRWSSWEDKQTGAKRNKIEVIVDDLELIGSRSAATGSDAADATYDEEVPF